MCLAVPTKVVELLPDRMALVEMGGVQRKISLDFVDNVKVGDYVIIHVGFALERLDPKEAQKTLELISEVIAKTDDLI